VSAVSVGNATITVTTEDGDHTANCAVKVSATPILVSDVTLNKTALALAVGGTDTLRATVAPDDATNKAVTWESSNTGVATVRNGTVRGVGAGSVTITVRTADGGYTAVCAVTVIVGNDNDIDFGPGATVTQTINVANATQWTAALNTITNGGPDKNYIINVTANFTTGVSRFGSATGIKISLRGSTTTTRTITMAADTGTAMIRISADHTVILRDLTLRGNNTSNTSDSLVDVESGGTFTMWSGTLTNNTTAIGSGVYVSSDATFTMHGGTISNNTATNTGGGVYVYRGTFDMYGGTISGNTSNNSGGGVYVVNSTFTMHGGTISGNKAGTNGGGVYVSSGGIFRIVTGTIYGSSATAALRNTATTSGAALYKNDTATAQRGTLGGADGTTWTSSGDLDTTNDTINVVNGELQ
jgi:hypothetical protein